MPLSQDRRPARKGDLQRDAIIEAMTRLLGHKSIAELSVADITNEAGATRSGFYFYFESKYAALSYASAALWSELAVVTGSYVRPESEPVADYVGRVLKEGQRIWQSSEVLLVASFQALPLSEELASTWRQQIARLTDLVSQQVERDHAIGLVAPGRDDVPGLVGRLVETTMYLLYRDRSEGAGPAVSDETVEILQHIWLTALGATH